MLDIWTFGEHFHANRLQLRALHSDWLANICALVIRTHKFWMWNWSSCRPGWNILSKQFFFYYRSSFMDICENRVVSWSLFKRIAIVSNANWQIEAECKICIGQKIGFSPSPLHSCLIRPSTPTRLRYYGHPDIMRVNNNILPFQ